MHYILDAVLMVLRQKLLLIRKRAVINSLSKTNFTEKVECPLTNLSSLFKILMYPVPYLSLLANLNTSILLAFGLPLFA
jgi:hypothetical protein